MSEPWPGAALSIEHVEVGEHRIEARVRVLDRSRMRTSAVPGLAARALELLPGLRRHTCENDAGRDALREFGDTETAHLLEHVAAELMALSGSPRSLRCETAWDFARDGAGVFRVRLGCDDRRVAVAALGEAASVVEWPLGAGGGDAPDVGAIVGRLLALRSA